MLVGVFHVLLNMTFYYSDTNSAGGKSTSLIDKDKNFKSFRNFAEVIQNKEYNNIFVIINESYPNFRDQKLKNSLIEKIMFNNEKSDARFSVAIDSSI